jgi:hypothetical protein
MSVDQSDDYIASALADSVDIAEITKNKLAGGFLNAIDNLVQLAGNATDERVKIAASWRVVKLALELRAVDLGPVAEFEQRWAKELRALRGNDD